MCMVGTVTHWASCRVLSRPPLALHILSVDMYLVVTEGDVVGGV